MKKSLFFAAVLLALAACTREMAFDTSEGGMTLVARMEGSAGTRTVIEGGSHIFWEPGDEIAVFSGGESGKFTADLSTTASTATFKGTLGTNGWTEGMDLWAVYPYSDKAAFDGETVTTVLPDKQVGRAGSFGKDMNPAIAHSTSSTLQFYNVGGGVRFTLSQDGITEVVFEGLGGETLAGKVKVDFQDGKPVILDVTEGKTSITVTPPEGETFRKDAWYYIVAIPGALENGFTFHFRKASDPDTEMPSSTYSKPVTIKRGVFGMLTYVDQGVDQTVSDDVITFKDPLVKSIVVKHFDTSGDGELSYHEAAVVLSFLVDGTGTRATDGMVSIFAGTGITTFDELVYFTGLTKIEDGAFAGCTELTSVIIPETVESIGADAFNGCTNLTSITVVSETPPAIGMDAFANTGDCPILVPEGAVEAYVAAWGEYEDRIRPNEYPEPEVVDLGLPSGVKWASFNLGASNPGEVGDYFAWGDPEPYYSSLDPLTWKEGKEAGYDWPSYKWCMGTMGTYTKYCFSGGYEGFKDDKFVLDPEDDAATVILGDKWRMPTAAEFMELLEKCDFELTSISGTAGWRITGLNGNSIFLPAKTGYWGKLELQDTEVAAYYWSSNLFTGVHSYSVYLNSSNENWWFYGHFKSSGLPIRPVYGDPGIPVESITLDKTELELNIGESATLTATVLPENATIKDYTWSSGDTSIATVSSTGVVTAVGPGSTWISVASYDPNQAAGCFVTVPYPVPEAIDLGLSVQWASFNLGAASQDESGGYFAWGETDSKQYFSWNPYKWSWGSYTTMTKYCTDAGYGYDGFTDGKTVLDPEDDAATVNLGGKWRMPTAEEAEELMTDCTWVWTTRNDLNGFLVTGPSGNSIFLPAYGYRSGSDIYESNYCGVYWSSSLNTTVPSRAHYLYFDEDNYKSIWSTNRSFGFTVRPVYGDRPVTTGGDIEGTEEEPWN